MLRCALLAALAPLLIAACDEAEGHEVRLRPAAVVPSANAPKVDQDLGAHPADDRVDPDRLAEEKLKGKNANWVPKEFSGNMSKWKDAGLYVDGVPLGFLNFGELPIALKPRWLQEKVSADKRPNSNDPGWRWARKRYYLFTDYLKAVGVDVRKVKELHVYSSKTTQTLIVTGKDLMSPKADQFWFWFGANTSGKPIPHCPEKFGNNRVGDKANGVMVYVNKKPPELVNQVGLFLDGVEQTGVPYYGEPVRGGVRVYLDDKLATIIKRQDLDPKQTSKASNGEAQWKLVDFLAAHGVDTKKVAEMWVVRGDKREEHFNAAELKDMMFQAGSQSRGGVLVGDKLALANVIALHTKPLKPADMPLLEQADE